MKNINFYRYPHPNNVGDTLTPYILQHFRPDIKFTQVREDARHKLIVVGSVMRVIQNGDVILGAGIMRETDQFFQARLCFFLAVRGKMTRDILLRYKAKVPEVYGDPALLLPLMYNPEIKKTHKVGIVPHFVDTQLVTPEVAEKLARGESYKIIDVYLPWREFVDELLTCEHVVASSLHGIIIAEAYGLSAEWVVLSDKVLGKGFKFRDYLTGTERAAQDPGIFPRLDPQVLKKVQDGLLQALKKI